jgi:hypothetical protein
MVITPAFQVGDVGSIPVTRTTQWASMFQGFGDLPLQGRCGGFDSHLVHKKEKYVYDDIQEYRKWITLYYL